MKAVTSGDEKLKTRGRSMLAVIGNRTKVGTSPKRRRHADDEYGDDGYEYTHKACYKGLLRSRTERLVHSGGRFARQHRSKGGLQPKILSFLCHRKRAVLLLIGCSSHVHVLLMRFPAMFMRCSCHVREVHIHCLYDFHDTFRNWSIGSDLL